MPALLAGLLDWRRMRRLKAAMSSTHCDWCGEVLGQAALATADTMQLDRLRVLQRRHPTSLVNVARRADACCTECGAAYAWDARSAGLLPVQDDD